MKQMSLKNPNEPATTKQTYTLWKLTKIDYRNKGLTQQEASDLIFQLKKKSQSDIATSIIEYFDDTKLDDFFNIINKIYDRLYMKNMTNSAIDFEYGIVGFDFSMNDEKHQKTVRKIIDEVSSAKSFVETVIFNNSKSRINYAELKYSLGILFIQNQEYLDKFYTYAYDYFLVKYPEIVIKKSSK